MWIMLTAGQGEGLRNRQSREAQIKMLELVASLDEKICSMCGMDFMVDRDREIEVDAESGRPVVRCPRCGHDWAEF